MFMGASRIELVLRAANLSVMLAANLLVQSLLLAAAGLLICWILKRKGAALRSKILRFTLSGILLCPVIAFGLKTAGVGRLAIRLPEATLPTRNVPVRLDSPPRADLQRTMSPAETEPIRPSPGGASVSRGIPQSVRSAERPVRVTRRPRKPDAPGRLAVAYIGLTGLWLLGSGLLLFRLLVAHLRLARLRGVATNAPASVRNTCETLARQMAVRTPRLLTSPRVSSPFLIGFFRPAILLPESGTMVNAVALREVLLHELAHLARRDCAWHLMSKLACAIVFFQPLMWILARRIEETSDEVADDYVVHHATDRWRYAHVLVDIAEGLQPTRAESLASVGVVCPKSSLGRRLWRILDTTRALSIHVSARATIAIVVLALSATVAASLIGAGEKPGADAAARLEHAITLRAKAYMQGREHTVDDLRAVVAILEELAEEYPDVDAYRGELGITQCLVGASAHRWGDTSVSSEEVFTAAINLLEPLTKTYPSNVRYKHHLAEAYSLGGWLLAEAGRPQEGLDAARQGVALSKEVAAVEPDNRAWPWYLMHILKRLSGQLIDLRLPHADTMKDVWRQLRAGIQLPLPESVPIAPPHIVHAGRVVHAGPGLTTADLRPLAHALSEQGRTDEAMQLYDEAVACIEELAVEDWMCRYHLPRLLNEYEAFLEAVGRKEEAEHTRAKRETFRQKLMAQFPNIFRECRNGYFGGPVVDFAVRVTTPGEYRLYVRLDGHDIYSGWVDAWIAELADGPGGAIADAYLFRVPADRDFGTNAWVGGGVVEDYGPPRAPEIPAVWPIAAPGNYTIRFGGPMNGMGNGTALDAFVLQRSDLPAPVGDGPKESRATSAGVFVEEDGRVTVEAEHYAARASSVGVDWLVVPDEDPGDVAHHNFRGTGYLQVLPDSSPTEEQEFERLMRRIQNDPEDATAYLARGSLYLNSAKDYENAVADFSTAIALQPENEDGWTRRGLVHAELGRWAEAARDFSKVAELEPHNAYDHYLAGIVELARGNIDSYRATCANATERFGDTDVPNEAYWAAWACALAPKAVSDFDRPIALAEKASQGSFSDDSCRTTLGGLLYRAGRFEEALASLQWRTNEDTRQSAPAYACFFLAMAHHRLGHATEAHAWLEKAVAKAEQEIQTQPPWNRRLTLGLLRQEAEGLIRQTETALGTNESDTRS